MVVSPHVTAPPAAAKTKPLIHSNAAVEDLLSGQQREGNYRAAAGVCVCVSFYYFYLVFPMTNISKFTSHINKTDCKCFVLTFVTRCRKKSLFNHNFLPTGLNYLFAVSTTNCLAVYPPCCALKAPAEAVKRPSIDYEVR